MTKSRRHIFLTIMLILFMLPSVTVHAKNYTLKEGKSEKGSYQEEDYNYYKIKPSKSGFMAVTVKTSDGSALKVDICNANKKVIAGKVKIKNKSTVFHKAKRGRTYYLRIKGKEGQKYSVSYTMERIETLTYAEKYSYTFTNASFSNQDNAIYLKIETNKSGILNFMCDANETVVMKYLDKDQKIISNSFRLADQTLTGIGVLPDQLYYIKMWRPDGQEEGTTTISGIKYQIRKVEQTGNYTKSKAATLAEGEYNSTLVPAGKSTKAWYKLDVTQKKKLSITIESRMLQNNGKCLRMYIYNTEGKKINTSPIVIAKEAKAKYKNKKYIMVYPRTTLKTTAEFPPGTYYLRVDSRTSTSSGAFRIKWE